MDMGEGGMYQMYGRGAHPLGGMFNRPPEMPWSSWLFYITVSDVNAAVDKVKALGGQILNGPMEAPGGDVQHGIRIELKAPATLALGVVHRHVGISDQGLRILSILR